MKYIASCSFGKDSLATVILAREHGDPLDEVVYCEVMFDEEISGEVPEHRDFIYDVAIPKLENWGVKTTVVRSKKTYIQQFTHVIKKGPKAGKISAFPLCGKCSIQRDCKLQPIRQYQREIGKDVVQYIGIAKDEMDRLGRLEGTKKLSLLDKYGVAESETFEICTRHGLLSPIYEFTSRGGCFFCPNAKEKELRHLYDHHPDLWDRLLSLQRLPNMFEIIIGNLIKIGYAMAIFLCAYLANVVFSLWYNIKINCEPFSREKLATGGLKALTFIVGLTLLCIAITTLPIFATEVGWTIPDEYAELFADLIIVGAVLLVACKYIKEAFTKFVAILNTPADTVPAKEGKDHEQQHISDLQEDQPEPDQPQES